VPDILAAASLELADAAQWYESHRTGLGSRFLDEVRDGFERIQRMPLAGSPWLHAAIPAGTRRVVLQTFPYSIVYVTEPRVVVVAVFSSRPGAWTRWSRYDWQRKSARKLPEDGQSLNH
jgi:toxin ParE1/3/4